jgi:hypothetical protein
MAKVKVFNTAVEGFRLIRREPKSVLAWGAALVVLLGAPGLLVMQQLSPLFAEASEGLSDEAADLLFARVRLFVPILWLAMIAAYTVFAGAVLRAVITPEDRRFLYLRLGKAEFWMALSAVVGLIMFYIALLLVVIALILILAVPMGLMYGDGTAPQLSYVHWVIVLAVIGAYYFMLRFSMAPIMSFAERRFRLFESWSFTRGNGWRLLGLAAVLAAATFLIEVILLLVFSSGLAPALLGAGSDPVAAERQILALYASPMIWLAVIIGGLLGGAYMALAVAPWARAYLAMKDDLLSPEPATA